MHPQGRIFCVRAEAHYQYILLGALGKTLRWSGRDGQIGGLRKLGPVVRHAASLMLPASSWTSTGVRPPCVE